jgi:SOS regulatory protein LexA
MAQGKITAKQEEILEYIKSQILERGFPPSVRDICEAVHLKSTSSVHSHLETLEKNGYIRRDPTKPRAIEILDDSFNFNRREMVNVPVIGHVAAGEPLLAEQNIENYFPIPMEYMPNKQTFMLKVHGESMINAFYGSGLVSAHDNVKDDPVRCKYYKSIQIHSGDTLWNIAEEYITEDYESVNAYITEVKKINKLSSDQIQDSQYLTVPYYDYR